MTKPITPTHPPAQIAESVTIDEDAKTVLLEKITNHRGTALRITETFGRPDCRMRSVVVIGHTTKAAREILRMLQS